VQVVARDSKIAPKNRSRFAGRTWFLVYVILATLDLAIVTFTLYQHHHVTSLLDQGAVADDALNRRQREIEELGEIASNVDAPANNVFLSRDRRRELAAMRANANTFAKALMLFRTSVAAEADGSPEVLRKLDRVSVLMRGVLAAGEGVFAAIDAGDLAAAGANNARMDASYLRVHRVLEQITEEFEAAQDRALAEQREEAHRMAAVQSLIALLILAIVAGMAMYGRALARQVMSDRERERYVADLSELNAELEQLGRKNELILKAAGDGILGLDVDCRPTFLNPAAEAMTGFSLVELRGTTLHSAVHHTSPDGSPNPAERCPNIQALRSGVASTVADDIFWRKDGTSFAVEYSVTPMRDEESRIVGAVLTFRDTTERRSVQRLKDEFVSLVSHELRTPLTSIRGALGLLANGLLARSPEKGQRMLDIAVSNTDRLIRLINDILDIERMESGKVTLEKTRCEPATLLHDSVELMRPMAEKAGVQIEVTTVDSKPVWADADRITQTITNLLSNAIKFSPPGATIRASAAHGREGIIFCVRDEGRGIPPEKLESIFERFQQVDASDSRDKGGSGLGLPICRGIVRQHGGELFVESVVGQGSVFSFSLPAAAPEHIATGRATGAKVIVCDDEPSVREMLQAMLELRGYEVCTADGGEELLRLARTFRPDVVILDIFMPVMGGWHAMAALKNDPETADIPVVILSVLTPDEAPAPFDPAGWVSKPLDERTLINTVEHALGLAGRMARILVVEDDFDLAGVITASFERHGIQTSHAATGQEAIAMISDQTPDLLILDLVLPELDGFGVVEWLSTREHLRNIPLIVYSASDPSAAERERLRLGPTHFFTKSRVPAAEFEQRVVHLLEAMNLKKGAFVNVA
jgi:PAS domain S-box-containing protein